MALAPDGRVFFNERLTGNIRIINPLWQLVNQRSSVRSRLRRTGNRACSDSHSIPILRTTISYTSITRLRARLRNRVVRYTEMPAVSVRNETIILDNLPASR